MIRIERKTTLSLLDETSRSLVRGLLALVFCLGSTAADADIVLTGRVDADLPSAVVKVPQSLVRDKYPNLTEDADVYTDATGQVNFVFSLTQQMLEPAQLQVFGESLRSSILRQYPTATWHESRSVALGSVPGQLFEFSVPVPDGTVHNIMVAASLDGRLLMMTFNVTQALEKQWLEVGRRTMASIRVLPAPSH